MEITIRKLVDYENCNNQNFENQYQNKGGDISIVSSERSPKCSFNKNSRNPLTNSKKI